MYGLIRYDQVSKDWPLMLIPPLELLLLFVSSRSYHGGSRTREESGWVNGSDNTSFQHWPSYVYQMVVSEVHLMHHLSWTTWAWIWGCWVRQLVVEAQLLHWRWDMLITPAMQLQTWSCSITDSLAVWVHHLWNRSSKKVGRSRVMHAYDLTFLLWSTTTAGALGLGASGWCFFGVGT